MRVIPGRRVKTEPLEKREQRRDGRQSEEKMRTRFTRYLIMGRQLGFKWVRI